MSPVAIARVCHEANRALQQLLNDPVVSPSWEDAPSWQTTSAIEGVLEAQKGATPARLHEAWCEAKVRDGWRYGPEKDSEERRHPCLVPYGELPPDQRAKDTVFAAIVKALS